LSAKDAKGREGNPNESVIANAVKQSRSAAGLILDGFAPLAMTGKGLILFLFAPLRALRG